MALLLQLANPLQLKLRNSDFLPLSTIFSSQGSRRRADFYFRNPELSLCILSQVSSDRFKYNVNYSATLPRFATQQFGEDCCCLPSSSIKARRSSPKSKFECNAAAASASSSSGAHADFSSVTFLGKAFSPKDVQFVCAAVATVLLASANKILYKMALVPLKRYPLFLAQFNTITYVVAYSSILLMRHRAGIVTKEMLAVPKAKFVMIGALEALGLAMSMASAAILPGAVIPVFAQVFLSSFKMFCGFSIVLLKFCKRMEAIL